MMNKLLITCCCFLVVLSLRAQEEGIFQFCEMSQINATQYRLESYFSGVGNNCFEDQVRLEFVHDDTVFIKTLYLFPSAYAAFGCIRRDTLERTQFSTEIHYVNVSAGIIKYGNQPGDTIWNRFDSTFLAPLGLFETDIPTFNWSCTNDLLKITGNQPVESIVIMSASGHELLSQNGAETDVSRLAAGIYFVRIFSQGSVALLRWYKE